MASNRRTKHPSLETSEEIKESLEVGLGRRGQDLDRWVTVRDLEEAGLARIERIGGRSVIQGPGGGGGIGGGIDPFEPPDFGQDDLTRPPAPTGVRANGLSLDAIGLTWNPPGYNNHAYAEVFASFSDNWTAISQSFNANRPVGPGNRPQHFMGTASGTLFVHRNLSSTVPTVNLERPILSVSMISGGFRVTLDGDARDFVSVGDTGYFSAPEEWEGNGIQGEVSSVNYVSGSAYTLVYVDGPSGFNTNYPTGTMFALVKDEDDLEQALTPQTIYYWVRFVSTAEVVGPVQSEAGVPGTVMLNPEEILNILTGRIRSSQLASDIVTPINFIRGPITELDENGNRKYPTVRDFVLAQGEGLISEYDEVWQQVIVGDIIEPSESEYGGIATAAAMVKSIKAKSDKSGSYIEDLQTLEAAFEEGTVEGLQSIVSTIQSRKLVEATDDGAIAYIGDTVQISVDEDTYALNQIGSQVLEDHRGRLYNSITLKAQQNQGGVLYAAGFGIGLEEDDDGDIESTVAFAADQFAIMSAANKGRIALRAQSVSSSDRTYTVVLDGGTSAADSDGLPIGAKVAITVPLQASQQIRNAFQGKTFKVLDRDVNSVWDPEKQETVVEIPVIIEEIVPDEDDPPPFVSVDYQFTGQNKGVAMFPEQSVPFIVNTTVDPPVVGIRGRLIVDGMISATDVEVTELLRAKEIWTTGMTVFGLLNAASVVGETIATPRFGGWAMKMTSPDTSYENRVFEFSRWKVSGHRQPFGSPPYTDDVPDREEDDVLNQRNLYPQLRGDQPDDTSFWLDAQGNAFVRGSIQVGGNARVLTYGGHSPNDWFVQMDRVFPLMIFPHDKSGAFSPTVWDRWDYKKYPNIDDYNTVADLVRGEALMWVHRDGTAGFNTSTDSIFLGDTPMEPPSGGFGIKVITRLDSGAPTGKGRVWVSVSFDQVANRHRPNNQIGLSYMFYLAEASKNYAGYGMTVVPTERNSAVMPDGSSMQDLQGEMAEKIDAGFVIIRAPTNSSGTEPDPGWKSLKDWETQVQNDEKALHFIGHSYSSGPPATRLLQGDVKVDGDGVAASKNYKVLVAIVERYNSNGDPIYGPIDSKKDPSPGVCAGIQNAKVFSQQVSTRGFEGGLVKNSNSSSLTTSRLTTRVLDENDDDEADSFVQSFGDSTDDSGSSVVAWGDVEDKPDTATRWPAWNEVTSKPSTFPPDAHTHAAGDITSGTMAYARLPISSTQVGNWDTAHGWGDWSVGVDKAFVDALNVDADTVDGQHASAFATGDNFSTTGTYSGVTVGNATNAGDADTVDGQHASAFAAASHTHNYLPLSGGTIDGGTNTTVTLLSNDTGESTLNLYGASQGTGRLYVGQSSGYGGGIEYNGDGSPATTGAGADYITLWRRANGVDEWTARNKYNSNNWEFRGAVTAASFSGSGSGLTSVDADTVDGQHASAFLGVNDKAADSNLLDGINSTEFVRSNANDIKTGYLRFNDNYELRLGSGSDLRIDHDGTNNWFRSYNHGADNIFQVQDSGGASRYFHMRNYGNMEIDGKFVEGSSYVMKSHAGTSGGNITVSTGGASGGSNGDIHLQV